MTYKENITAILECCFAGFKEEIIEGACNRILGLETKTGHWIEEKNDYGEVTAWHCDNCYEDSGFFTTCAWDFCPNCGAKMIEQKEDKNKKCEDCTEWEYFDGYGYGCFCMKTMTPIDANKCEFYTDKRPDIPQSWKPSNVEPQESEV